MNPLIWLGIAVGSIFSMFGFFTILAFFSDQSTVFLTGAYTFFKDIVGPIAAGFGGAIAGALATYRIQSITAERKSQILDINNYNKAMQVLLSKHRDLWTYKSQVVEPYEHKELRFLYMPDFPEMPLNSFIAHDYLSELLIRAELGGLLSTLITLERRYIATLHNLWQRNRMILTYRAELDEFFRMRKTRYVPQLSDFVRIHSHTRVLRLYELTEATIKDLDETMNVSSKLIVDLQEMLAPHIAYKDIKGLKVLEVVPFKSKSTAPCFYKDTTALSEALDEAMKIRKKKNGRGW